MGQDEHPLDLEFLANQLWGFMPPSVRLIFEHYQSLHAGATTALVLPSEVASYLVLEHPRIEGSAQLGIKPHDGLIVLPNTLTPEELTNHIPSVTTNLIAFFHHEAREVDKDEAVTFGQRTEACLEAVADEASVDLVVPATLVETAAGAGMREYLLTRGQVTDLFDGGKYWYVGWLGEPPDAGHRTQVVEIPPPDEWSEFAEDLKTWMPLWRWGDLTTLPDDHAWGWSALKPDLVSMLLRLHAEMEGATTSTPASTVAHARLGFIELSLRYLVELRLGGESAQILPLLRPNAREAAEAALAGSGRENVLSHINLINFKQILQKAWPALAPVFDDDALDKRRFLHSLDAANEIRNKTAHPSKLARITSDDLALLMDLVSILDKAIETAERLASSDT